MSYVIYGCSCKLIHKYLQIVVDSKMLSVYSSHHWAAATSNTRQQRFRTLAPEYKLSIGTAHAAALWVPRDSLEQSVPILRRQIQGSSWVLTRYCIAHAMNV